MNTGSPKNNNLGTFYTNLGNTVNNVNKGLNSIGNNVNKGLNSIGNNVTNVVNNMNKGLNNFANDNSKNENISSLLPFKTNTANNGKNVTNSTKATNVTKNQWVMPFLVFIVVATVFIVIFVRFQDKINAGINNIIQKVRDAFNKSSTPPVDASNPPEENVNERAISPQDEEQVNNALQNNNKRTNILDKILPAGKPEVFNVSENEYTYYDAEPLCMALGAELATYEQVKDAWSKGADWCNYGWVKGQAAVYPTQDETWQKVQSGPEENRNSCGVPGLNGGYFENPEMKFGVNCYGPKPPQSQHSQEVLMKEGKIPLSVPALEVDKKVQEFKTYMDRIGILPFNEGKWQR
jgi:hypothetical protein